MDLNKRNDLLTFYKNYMEYLSAAQNRLTDEDEQRLRAPLLLSTFEKDAIISILKETISKLSVVNSGYDGKNRIVDCPPAKLPMNVRFKNPILDKLYDEDTLEPLRDCFAAMSMNKLENDIELIRYALETCCNDLEQFGSFTKFVDFILDENREAYDEYNLLTTYYENLTKLNELQKERKLNRCRNDEVIEKLNADLFRLKTECENKEKTNRLEENMVKKWENARQEQVDAIFNHELKRLHQLREDYEEKAERELIVINKIMAFYQIKCKKLEESIESWQKRYDAEKCDLDEQIKHTEQCIVDTKAKCESIRDCYQQRAKFIEEYYVEQKKLDEIRRIEDGQRAAAIYIQAWWRGIMVRKQLGPYRPKKKSKKPKTGKKK